MLERSIPQYEVMRRTVTDLTRLYHRGGKIVDLGCSRGSALAPLVDSIGARGRFVGLDVSEPMVQAARERFAGLIESGVVRIESWDLRDGLPGFATGADVILAVLTVQFTPIEYRQEILRAAHDALNPGGALILVEKVLGQGASMDRQLVRLYLDHKRRSGYSEEEIDRKRHSLEGVLVPVTARMNESLLAEAGFRNVECVWRWCNFAAWLAVRD